MDLTCVHFRAVNQEKKEMDQQEKMDEQAMGTFVSMELLSRGAAALAMKPLRAERAEKLSVLP